MTIQRVGSSSHNAVTGIVMSRPQKLFAGTSIAFLLLYTIDLYGPNEASSRLFIQIPMMLAALGVITAVVMMILDAGSPSS